MSLRKEASEPSPCGASPEEQRPKPVIKRRAGTACGRDLGRRDGFADSETVQENERVLI